MTQLICREETCLNGSILRLLSQSSEAPFLFCNKSYFTFLATPRASLVVQAVKNPPAMQDTWVQSLGLEDPLEEARQSTPAFLAGEFPQTEEPGGLQCMGPQRVRHS